MMCGVLVTGAAGLIGGRLARQLHEAGATVVGVTRRKTDVEHCAASYQRSFGENLGEIVGRHALCAVIHCAHDMSPQGGALSERGTVCWAEELSRAGVTRQVFISSISARNDARTSYGQVKHRLEQWFLSRGGTIFRLGLVIGPGGLFQRMVEIVRKSPVVPLIDGGRTRVYYNDLDFVARQVAAATLEWRGPAAWNLQQPEPTTMREVLVAMRDALDSRARFIPVPYWPVLATAWILDRCRIKGLGISYENVVGLRQNDLAAMHSDFIRLGGEVRSIRDLVWHALESELQLGKT